MTIRLDDNFTVQQGETYSSTDDTAVFWVTGASTPQFMNLGHVTAANVSGDARAFLGGNAGVIRNQGVVEVTSNGWAWGYASYFAQFGVSVINDGWWSVSTSSGIALGLSTNDPDIQVTNNGNWIVHGRLEADGMYFFNKATVTNTGGISVTSDNDVAYGLWLDWLVSIVNSGEIVCSGGLGSIGILVSGLEEFTAAPNIVNFGTITAEIAIQSYNAGYSPEQNKTEWVVNYGALNGIIDLGLGADRMENAGTINGDVYMFDGNDLVDTRSGIVNGIVALEAGDDTFLGGRYGEIVLGGDGNDWIVGGFGDDVLAGGTGNNYLSGGEGIDLADYFAETSSVWVDLAAGAYTATNVWDTFISIEGIVGGAGNDMLFGDASGNFLFGGDGGDTLIGRDGGDTLVGEAGDDWLEGGVGDDLLEGGVGINVLIGGEGIDLASYASQTANLWVEMTAGVYSAAGVWDVFFESIEGVLGGSGSDTIFGNAFANTLRGGGGNDALIGAGGDDVLEGGAGADWIVGGEGNDRLIGGEGVDVLTGGAGADTFDLGTAAGWDVAFDFNTAEDRFSLGGLSWLGFFTIDADGDGQTDDTLLGYAGGNFVALNASGLSLTQWNALVDAPAGAAAGTKLIADADPLSAWADPSAGFGSNYVPEADHGVSGLTRDALDVGLHAPDGWGLFA